MEQPIIKILGFKTTYHKKQENVELVPRDWVRYAPLHDINTVTEEMISQLRPPENGLDRDDEGVKMGYMSMVWRQIEPHYIAWKQGTEIPESGIPLSAWAGVTVEQAEVLRKTGIRTVEEVSTLTEGQIGRVNLPGVRNLKQLAAEFLASRSGADTASKVTALAEQNDALKAQLEEMASMIAEMRAEKAGDADAEDEAPIKRKPGRPRKAEIEEAA